MQLGHYERAMIRRVRPTGRGRDVLDQSSRPHPLQLDATPRQAYIDLFCPHLYRASSHYPNVNDQDHDNNRVITYNIKAGTDVRTTVSGSYLIENTGTNLYPRRLCSVTFPTASSKWT